MYIAVFPLIGLAALAWMAARTLIESTDKIGRFLKNLLLFLASPFIGIAYTIALPIVGLVMLARRRGKRGQEHADRH